MLEDANDKTSATEAINTLSTSKINTSNYYIILKNKKIENLLY